MLKKSNLLITFLIITLLIYIFISNNLFVYLTTNYLVILQHYAVSLFETISSIILSVLISLLVFFYSIKIKAIRTTTIKILLIFQTIPLIVIAPLLLTIFGFSIWVKIFVVSILGVYPILVNIDKSFNDINNDYYVITKLGNFTNFELTKHLILPSIITSLFSGIRLTTSYAFASIILTEFIGGRYGLGIYLARALKNFDQSAIIIIVLISIITTFVLLKIVSLLEKIILHKKYGGLS